MKHAMPDLTAISLIEWARLAAFIDGEGCIRIATVKGHSSGSRRVMYVEVSVVNTDVRLVQWLVETFGGSTYTNNKRSSLQHAPCFGWVASSRHAATLIAACLPYFLIKREQADVALAFQNTILPGRPYGRTGRPPELLAKQEAFANQLSVLKGTSGQRGRVPAKSLTVQ